MTRLRDRPTGELLIIMIASTICFSVIATGATVVIVELVHPSSDTTKVTRQIADILNTLIGLLAGFLAGRTDANAETIRNAKHADDEP